jgi:hypothetical protein
MTLDCLSYVKPVGKNGFVICWIVVWVTGSMIQVMKSYRNLRGIYKQITHIISLPNRERERVIIVPNIWCSKPKPITLYIFVL